MRVPVTAVDGFVSPAMHHPRTWLFIITMSVATIQRWEPAPFDGLVLILTFAIVLRIPLVTGFIKYKIPLGLILSLYFMILIQGATIFRSADFDVSMRYWLITAFMVPIAIIGTALGQHLKVLQDGLTALLIGSMLMLSVGIINMFVSSPLSMISSGQNVRLTALFKNPNAAGSFTVMLLVLSLDAAIGARHSRIVRVPRWAACAFVLIAIMSLILSASRSALGASILTTSLYAATILRNHRKGQRLRIFSKVVLASILIIIAAMGFWRLAPEGTKDYMQSKFDRPVAENPRFNYQREALERFGDYPFLGRGPATSGLDMGLGPHNVYIKMLYEHGTLGLVTFLIPIACGLWFSAQAALTAKNDLTRRVGAVCLAILASQLAIGFLMDLIHQRHLWLFVGLAWSLANIQQNRDVGPVRSAS